MIDFLDYVYCFLNVYFPKKIIIKIYAKGIKSLYFLVWVDFYQNYKKSHNSKSNFIKSDEFVSRIG